LSSSMYTFLLVCCWLSAATCACGNAWITIDTSRNVFARPMRLLYRVGGNAGRALYSATSDRCTRMPGSLPRWYASSVLFMDVSETLNTTLCSGFSFGRSFATVLMMLLLCGRVIVAIGYDYTS